MTKLNVCLVAAEVAPFAKTGGLADVTTGLARFLVEDGHDVRIVMPLYSKAREAVGDLRTPPNADGIELRNNDGGTQKLSMRIGTLPGQTEVPLWFVDCPALFDHGGVYASDGQDHRRYATLCRAALEFCQRQQWRPDILHCNDWHTALLPIYLRTLYAWDQLFKDTKTLLTIHNIGYQGVFGTDVLDAIGLRDQQRFFHQEDYNAGRVNFMRAGVMYADWINTVSRTYAQEILTEEFGAGLQGDLQQRKSALSGIVNGVDYGDWNPETDDKIATNFDATDPSGKVACKRALLERFDLPVDVDVPLLGVVSRLTSQKGLELLPDCLPVLLREEPVRLVVLGSGEEKFEEYFQWLRDRFPEQVGVFRGFNDELAHQIEAGADLFVMPSRFEPCGLNQMYSLKYGTVPVVRRTGGLADTVEQYDAQSDVGTGFTFGEFTSQALLDTLRFALGIFKQREPWERLMLRGMRKDFSWRTQGREYVALYRALRN